MPIQRGDAATGQLASLLGPHNHLCLAPTQFREHLDDIADRLEVGGVVINDCLLTYGIPALPFGGVKESGFGRSHGEEGLIELSRVKTVVEDILGLGREFFWFPYHPRTYDVLKLAIRAMFGPPRRLLRVARRAQTRPS